MKPKSIAMKKRLRSYIFIFIACISISSYVYLNSENPDFAILNIKQELPAFNVSHSNLPDVEAVKNTLIFIKEIILFDF